MGAVEDYTSGTSLDVDSETSTRRDEIEKSRKNGNEPVLEAAVSASKQCTTPVPGSLNSKPIGTTDSATATGITEVVIGENEKEATESNSDDTRSHLKICTLLSNSHVSERAIADAWTQREVAPAKSVLIMKVDDHTTAAGSAGSVTVAASLSQPPGTAEANNPYRALSAGSETMSDLEGGQEGRSRQPFNRQLHLKSSDSEANIDFHPPLCLSSSSSSYPQLALTPETHNCSYPLPFLGNTSAVKQTDCSRSYDFATSGGAPKIPQSNIFVAQSAATIPASAPRTARTKRTPSFPSISLLPLKMHPAAKATTIGALPVRLTKPLVPILRTSSLSSTASSRSSGSRRGGERRSILISSSHGSHRNINGELQKLGSSDVAHSLLGLALQLTNQEWSQLGNATTDTSKTLRSNTMSNSYNDVAETEEGPTDCLGFQDMVDRITALLLVRLLPVASPTRTFPDLSTTTICRTVLVQPDTWPQAITMTVLEELQAYVTKMLQLYRPYIPFHNAEHAYHVTVSTNKLLDLMLGKQGGHEAPTFGLQRDPLRLLCLVWAALIHDVDHHGVPNRQLATELIDHTLALRYNDKSIAENHSLFLAFDELLRSTTTAIDSTASGRTATHKPLYANLRKVMCPTKGEYFTFRKHVINMVLHTDIASPEMTELSKSKFEAAEFDAFVHPHHHLQHQSNQRAPGSEDKGRGCRRRSNRAIPTLQRRKSSINVSITKAPLSWNFSSTLHDADSRSTSESELSCDMSHGDTSESSDVSGETQITATTSVSGNQPRRRKNNKKVPDDASSQSSSRNWDSLFSKSKAEPFHVSEAMKHGVQVIVKTASESSLCTAVEEKSERASGGMFAAVVTPPNLVQQRNEAMSACETAVSEASVGMMLKSQLSDVAHNDFPASTTPTFSASPDKTPAAPRRRKSGDTTTLSSSEDDSYGFTSSIKYDSPYSAHRSASGKTLAPPQRNPSQDPATSDSRTESFSFNGSASLSLEQPHGVPVPSSPDTSTETVVSVRPDKTPSVPARRGSVAFEMDTVEAGNCEPSHSSSTPVGSDGTAARSPATERLVADCTPTTTPTIASTFHTSQVFGDMSPAFPQRTLSHAIDQIKPGVRTSSVKTNEFLGGDKRDNSQGSGSDTNPSLPQRLLTASPLGAFRPSPKVQSHNKSASRDPGSQLRKYDHRGKEDTKPHTMAERQGVIYRNATNTPAQTRRRHASASRTKNIFKRRNLGICCAMDWSGEMLQPYKVSSFQDSCCDDQADELKASVVMEIIMAVADVSQYLQSFDQMVIWSNKLFMELRRAHAAGRGPDMSQHWFRNQIGFLEHYVLPLAAKLDETGVFGPVMGPTFVRLVEGNRDRWLLDGEKVTAEVTQAGMKAYPDGISMPIEEPRALARSCKDSHDLPASKAISAGFAAKTPQGTEVLAADGPDDCRMASLQSVNRELVEVKKRLKDVVEENEQKIAKIASAHNKKVDDLEREFEEVSEEYDRARSKMLKLVVERDEARRSLNWNMLQREIEVESLREKLMVVEKENESMKKRIDDLTGQTDQHEMLLMLERVRLLEEKENLQCGLRGLIVYHEKEETRLRNLAVKLKKELSSVHRKGSIDKVDYVHRELSETKEEEARMGTTLQMLRSQYHEQSKRLWEERHRLVQEFGNLRDNLSSILKNESEEIHADVTKVLMSAKFTDCATVLQGDFEFSGISDDNPDLLLTRQFDEWLDKKRPNSRKDKYGVFSELSEAELLVRPQKQSLGHQDTFRHLQQGKAGKKSQIFLGFTVALIGVVVVGFFKD